MKWNFLKGLQTAAAALSCVTMLMTPLAQGAQANNAKKEEFKRFLKMSGFDHPKNSLTVGEFHRKFREWYPQPLRAQLDDWVSRHRHEQMPKVDTTIIKDSNGEDQLRMFFTKDGQSFTITTGDGFAQIGSVKMTAADYHNPEKFIEKISTKDNYVKNLVTKHKPDSNKGVSIALTKKEFASFTKKQRAQYLLQLSLLTRKAAYVLTPVGQSSRKTSSVMNPAFEMIARWVVGEPAFCEIIPKKGDSCIVAGWVATYGENRSCGGVQSGRAQWNQQIKDTFSSAFPKSSGCSAGSFPCNPLVYGFQSSGQAYCINEGKDLQSATLNCNNASPLTGQNDAANARRIVESWLAAQGDKTALEFNEKGELRADQYEKIAGQLEALNSFIGQAEAACDSAEGQKLQEKRGDQRQACEEIRKRRLALQKFIVAPAEGGDSCAVQVPGACMRDGVCVCDDGNPPKKQADGSMSCNGGDELLGPVEKKKTNWWPWIIGGALVAGVASCLLWWCKSKDKGVKTPPVTPPVDDCDINPTLPKCQPVDPCVANPTAPNCQPPPPPPPPPPTSEGGTGTPDPDVSGGIR